jgi:SAM-dependent methyltransferase
VIAAVEQGWFRPGQAAIDLGCGEGEIAAWLAEHGFPTLGVDIAPAAIQRARTRFGTLPPRLDFQVHDICADPLPAGPYGVLVDRGCFHQIAAQDRIDYARNLMKASAADASLLLFHKAFRKGIPLGDPKERRRVTDIVQEGLREGFQLEKSAETFLDPCHGADSERALPGLVFWMKRR